jgi:hypothetical protein
MNPPLILEVQHVRFGLGLRTQRWSKTRHVILNVGTVEARVIVPNERTGGGLFVLGLLLSGVVAGLKGTP